MCNLQSICEKWGTEKFRISEEPQAENLQKTSSYFKDEVYTRIANVGTRSKMFAADLYCHKNCNVNYIGKWDMINQDDGADLKRIKLKAC